MPIVFFMPYSIKMNFINKIVTFLRITKLARHEFGRISTNQTNFAISKFKINTGLYLSFLFLKTKRPFLLLWTVPFLSSKKAEGSSKAFQPKNVDLKKEIQKAVTQSDELFSLNKFQEAASVLLPFQVFKKLSTLLSTLAQVWDVSLFQWLECLVYEAKFQWLICGTDSGDVEVLWRLGRAQYKQSQQSSVTEPERRRLVTSAYDVLCDAVMYDSEHWAVHKWLSVLLDARSTYDGIKARVSQLEKVKKHMLRAAELNPKDATTLYMLGSWCYHIADMPWVQRKIAATIFAEPPKSSFEEALHYFTRAEEVQPRFYSQNLLMVGKTLLKLQRPKEAYVFLTRARDFPSSSDEDDQVRKEAAEILKNLKINENER